MNEPNQESELGEATGQPAQGDSASLKERNQHQPIVGWRDRTFERITKRLSCPNCGNDNRMDFDMIYKNYDDIPVLYYKCQRCRCQFSRRPRTVDILDQKGRI